MHTIKNTLFSDPNYHSLKVLWQMQTLSILENYMYIVA